MKHSKRFVELIDVTKKEIREIDALQVSELLKLQANFRLVDVREKHEWDLGHLPQAIHLSKGVIERDIEIAVPNLNEKIILYCGGGSRSALAAENLQKMGYNNVLSMEGGFRGWQALNLPIEK